MRFKIQTAPLHFLPFLKKNLSIQLKKFSVQVTYGVTLNNIISPNNLLSTRAITLNNITPFNNLLLNLYLEISPLYYIFYMFLTCMPILMLIGCYLPFNL